MRTPIQAPRKLGLAVAGTLLSAWAQGAPLEKITINYATRTGTTWPLYIAKEGGYFEKYGLDANLVFGGASGGHRDAGQRRGGDDQLSAGAGHAGQLEGWVAGDGGEPYKKSLFALMAAKTFCQRRAI